MKKITCTALLVISTSVGVLAQGTLGPGGQGTFAGGNAAITFDNSANSDASPAAAAGGLVFLNNGVSTSLLNQDINMELLVGANAVVTYLLSDGSAAGIGTAFGNGVFIDNSGNTIYLTGIAGGTATSFTIEAWTGNGINSYAAAQSTPGTYFGSVTFSNPTGNGGTPPSNPTDFTGMPALVLSAVSVPEPTTLALGALGGLAMLALRRRQS